MCQRRVSIYKWKDLGDIHEKIYDNNKMLSPYQSNEFLGIVGLGKNDRNPFETLGFKEQNFVLFDAENEPIAIAPLFSKKEGKGNHILLRGYFTSAGHLDFIYRSNFTYKDFLYLINEIKSYYKLGTIIFDRISEHSLIYKYAVQQKKYQMKDSVLVTINLSGDYGEWFSGLSKSVRQNIRTSYNRLKKDEKEFLFKLYYNTKPNKETKSDIIKLFVRRLCDHSKINSKIVGKVLYFLKRKHPMTRGITEHPRYIGGTLYIENVLVAFFEGVVGNDRRILVPRLSINIDYGRYSPGGVLINETMKKILAMKEFTEFDLQRGDETYKYSYGGVEYKNYTWTMSF